jgi:hypothetical protein
MIFWADANPGKATNKKAKIYCRKTIVSEIYLPKLRKKAVRSKKIGLFNVYLKDI